MDAGVRDQVGLELVQIDVQGAVEAERRGDGRDDLGDQAVKVLVARPGNVQIPAADVVHGLVVNQEGAVRVLDGAVGGQDGVVGLDDGRGQARGRVHGELQLALLGKVGRQALEEQSAETGTSATAEGVEDQEALEGVAVVYDLESDMYPCPSTESGALLTGDTADALANTVNHLLADGVVTAGIVVGSVLLPAHQELGVEELAVVAGADLIDRRGVEVDEDGAGDIFAAARLVEEGLERARISALGVGVRKRAAIRPKAMLKQVPSSVR